VGEALDVGVVGTEENAGAYSRLSEGLSQEVREAGAGEIIGIEGHKDIGPFPESTPSRHVLGVADVPLLGRKLVDHQLSGGEVREVMVYQVIAEVIGAPVVKHDEYHVPAVVGEVTG
jgi:hypothetical protein